MHSLVFCMQFSWVIRAFSSTKYLEAYLLLYTCLLTLLFLFECNRDPSIITLLFALSFEWSKAGSDNRIHSLFERALADDKLQKSVLLWRCYLAYEAEIACNSSAARRVFFRAIHACPWYDADM